jgi:hypothetical protein
MAAGRQPVVVRLKAAHGLRLERMGECLWPSEKLGIGEISRRLLLERLLWAESERNMVQSSGDFVSNSFRLDKEKFLTEAFVTRPGCL